MHTENNSKEIADNLITWLRDYAASNIDAIYIDEQGSFPPHVFLDLGNQGFFGTHISRKYGGLELKTFDILRVIEQVGAIDLTLAMVLIENIQGSYTLEKYASESMKNLYLYQLAAGRIFMAGAMTESEAGSNPRAMKSVAVANSTGTGWILNGSKRWVGMGSSANVIAIYVHQLDDTQNWQGMSGFLVPQGIKGLRIGPEALTMGIRGFSKSTIFMEDIKVSSEHLLGKEGEGMEIAQDNMMYIRLALAAATVGAMKRCIQMMLQYAKRRMIATGLLIDNPVTLMRLSEMTAIVDALDNFVYLTAQFYDKDHTLVPEEAFIVSKILGSEYLGWIVDLLLQMLGARGYEEVNGISKIYRDARAFRIFEGPTEALNMYIGSRVLEKNNALEFFIAHVLKQKDLYSEIKIAVSRAHQFALNKKQNLFDKPFVVEYWVQALVGNVVSYGLLRAGLEYRLLDNPSDQIQRAYIWVKNKYQECVQKTMAFSVEEQTLLPLETLQSCISNYTQTIGHIESTCHVDGKEIDNLLKSNPELDVSSRHGELKCKLMPHTLLHPEIEFHPDSSVFTEADDSKNLINYNQTIIKTKKIPELCAHQLFETIAHTHPDRIAVSWQDKKLSYAGLNHASNKIAHFLINEGVEGNQLVAIYIERSIEMIVGLMGVLKSGAAYLPLDYNYPEKNLKFMFEDSGAAFLLTQRKFVNDIPFEAKKIIFIEDLLENLSLSTANPNLSYHLDNTCYVLYTSGSTGYPKGVMLPHKALTNLMCWHLEKTLDARNVLQFTTLNFDMSFIEIFSAFCSGGTLTVISEHERLDLFGIAKIIQQNKIQQLIIPVPFLKSLAEAFIDKMHFKSLCEIIVAGEQLIITPAILMFFKQLDCKLWNYYGPAETHVVSAFEYPPDREKWLDYAPIGKPISNTKILILDDEKHLVPVGGVGEIYIGGVALASGYINRRELTQEKFISDPWGTHATDRLYQTGDFGKYLLDNTIVYLGRKDEQVKIRGFRIELQEIELHLTKHPAIKEAVVIAKKSVLQDKHLEAFIVTDNEVNAYFIDDLYSFLQERLSPHMLPSKFNFIKHMPLTNSGKINRNVLEEYESTISYSIDNIIEPITDTEKDIINIMEDIFKLKIGTNYSFISIGGNSLLAMHVVSILRDKFDIEIPAHSIVSAPTIAHIAKRIDSLICYVKEKDFT